MATVNDGYVLVKYPDDWGMPDRPVRIETSNGVQVIVPDGIQLISTEQLLAAGCTIAPLVALDTEIVEAIERMAATYWLTHAGETETYRTVKAWLAQATGGDE